MSHKDINQALKDVVDSCAIKEDDIGHNYKDDEDEPAPRRTVVPTKVEFLLDQDEVNSLIEASNPSPVEFPEVVVNTNYPTYSVEEVNELINGKSATPRKKKRR